MRKNSSLLQECILLLMPAIHSFIHYAYFSAIPSPKNPNPVLMTLIYGKRVAKIKEFTDHSHSCPSCKAFDLRVKVTRGFK